MSRILINIEKSKNKLRFSGDMTNRELNDIINFLIKTRDEKFKQDIIEQYENNGWKVEKESNNILLFSQKLD